MEKKLLTDEIKKIIAKEDSNAKVILFGSRARGAAKSESDWDILILLAKPKVTAKDEQLFRHKLYDLELESGESISTFVYSQSDWNTKLSVTPFYNNVIKEGIYL